jgi:hypothetical protein
MDFYEEHGIKIRFSVARTPQPNGVFERKKKIVIDMTKTMLKHSKLSNVFWVQEMYTTIHILNRGILKSENDKALYELWKGRPANIKHFRVF